MSYDDMLLNDPSAPYNEAPETLEEKEDRLYETDKSNLVDIIYQHDSELIVNLLLELDRECCISDLVDIIIENEIDC